MQGNWATTRGMFKFNDGFAVASGKHLKMQGQMQANIASNSNTIEVQLSTDDFVLDTTVIKRFQPTTTSTYSINEDIDLSAYAGSEVKLRLYTIVGENNKSITMTLNKFLIE